MGAGLLTQTMNFNASSTKAVLLEASRWTELKPQNLVTGDVVPFRHCPTTLCDLCCDLDSIPDCCCYGKGDLFEDLNLNCHTCFAPCEPDDAIPTIDFELKTIDYDKAPYSFIAKDILTDNLFFDTYPATICCEQSVFDPTL